MKRLRVISGSAKGKKLKAPSGITTRPITDMIKEALFNILGSDVNGSCFLDLFAGSGSIGIEALSRGAHLVIFIDRDAAANRIIRSNLDNCGFNAERYEVHRNDVFNAVNALQKRNMKFDFIYIDPPFTDEDIFERVLFKIDDSNIIKTDSIIIIRTRRNKKLPENLQQIKSSRINNYGESTLHFYRLKEGRASN